MKNDRSSQPLELMDEEVSLIRSNEVAYLKHISVFKN